MRKLGNCFPFDLLDIVSRLSFTMLAASTPLLNAGKYAWNETDAMQKYCTCMNYKLNTCVLFEPHICDALLEINSGTFTFEKVLII